MKFTIVTPSYNQGDYVGRTIDSIIRQEGDFEIQYLIRDGGSTDQSVDIFKQTDALLAGNPDLGNRGVEFSWISEKDGGQSAAINSGLRLAEGDICAFLNSDDMYIPGAFAAVAKAFQQMPEADFVYGDGQVTDENDQLQWRWLSRPYDFDVLTQHHEFWNSASNYISQASTFWRRSVMDKIGYFDEVFHFAMDLEYWVRAGKAGLRLEHLPVELSMFRVIAGTKTTSGPTVQWPDTIEMLRRHAPDKLQALCAYYFYNVVLKHKWDMAAAMEEYKRETETTHKIPANEMPEYREVLDRAARLGRVVCATDRLRRGDEAVARQFYDEAMQGSRGIGNDPIVWRYRFRRAIGRKGRELFEGFAQRWVHSYRQRKFDYRYAQAQSE